MDNFIKSPENVDWNQIKQRCDTDTILFQYEIVSLLCQNDQYWKLIPKVIDICPYPIIIEALAVSISLLEFGSSYFTKTFNCLYSVFENCFSCADKEKQKYFVKQIICEWNKQSSKSSKSVLGTLFDRDCDSVRFGDPEEYKQIVDLLYLICPQEIKEFFNSDEGVHFWRAIKRLDSVDFIGKKYVQIIDELTGKLGLPPITFEVPDLNKIFSSLGWKQFEQRKEEKYDLDEIIDVVNIGDMCYLTDPCQHEVMVILKKGNKTSVTMALPKIVAMYQKLGKNLPENIKSCVSKNMKKISCKL